jgi:polysaccharide biosynthesis transport protein
VSSNPNNALPPDPLDDAQSARKNVLRALAVFRRRGWIAVLVAAGAVGALVTSSLLRPAVYVSRGMVQLGIYAGANIDPRSPAATAMFDTNIKLLTSHEVVDEALRAMGEELVDGPGRLEQRALFLQDVTITPVQDTFLIEVEAKASDPQRAARAVNALMDAFIPFSDQFLGSRDALRERQLRDEEQRLLVKLQEAEGRQRAFYDRVGLIKFDDQRANPLVRQQELQQRLTTVQMERALAQAEKATLDAKAKEIADRPEVEQLAAIGGDDPLVSERRAAIAELNVRLSNLTSRVPADKLEGVDEYRQLRAQLESRRREFRELLQSAVREALAISQQRANALQAQETELRGMVEEQAREVARLNLLEGQYRSIRRDIEFHEGELTLTRNELRRLQTRTLGGTGAAIVDRGEVPATPKARVGAVALLAVAILAFGMALLGIILWDHIDDAVMRSDDLVDLSVPLLGQVPHLELGELDELTYLRGSSWAAEALSLIRTNLAFKIGGRGEGVLLVTSGGPTDGKSFFSLNLATALARSGGKTLLIEGDMRRPRLRPLLVIDDRPEGLSDLLEGEVELKDVIRDTEFDGLDFLPSGACPLNAADSLLRGDVDAILARALEAYDHVVIDGPPAVPLADASLLARHAHGVLHVARAGGSRRSGVQAAIDQIASVGGKNIGVVLNDVNAEDEPSFRYDGYDADTPPRGPPVQGGFFVVLPEDEQNRDAA